MSNPELGLTEDALNIVWIINQDKHSKGNASPLLPMKELPLLLTQSSIAGKTFQERSVPLIVQTANSSEDL